MRAQKNLQLPKPKGVADLIQSFENPHIPSDDTDQRLENITIEDDWIELPKELQEKYQVPRKQKTTADREPLQTEAEVAARASSKEMSRILDE